MNYQQFEEQFRLRNNQHPFWNLSYLQQETLLSRDQLRTWAIQAGRIDEVFVEVLGNMLQIPELAEMYSAPIRENLNDELGNGNPSDEHFTMFRSVLHALGITDEEYENTQMTIGTERIVEGLRYYSQYSNDPLPILSLMASEELICPREFSFLLPRLSEFITEDAMRYFQVHIEADQGHSSDLIRMCYNYVLAHQRSLNEVFMWQERDLNNNVLFYQTL